MAIKKTAAEKAEIKAAADKAAADKYLAKVATQKEKDAIRAAEKAANNKIKADKAAADKVIADKKAADKAANDKIKADKAAADKASDAFKAANKSDYKKEYAALEKLVNNARGTEKQTLRTQLQNLKTSFQNSTYKPTTTPSTTGTGTTTPSTTGTGTTTPSTTGTGTTTPGNPSVETDSTNPFYPDTTMPSTTSTGTTTPGTTVDGDYYTPKFTVPTSTADSPKAKGDKNVTTQQVITREPEYMENIRLNLLGAAADLTSRPKVLAEYKVAGMSPEQREAITMAREGIGAYEPYMLQAGKAYNQAGGLYAGTTGAYDPNSALAYMNPYQAAVTQRAVEEMSRQAGIQKQGVAAQAVKAGAFGGGRFGVQQAELGRGLADIQSQRIMQDYSQNYSQAQQAAMSAFQNQQARAQASAAGIAGLGSSTAALGQQTSALGQGDTSYLYNMGQKLQTQNQATLEAARLNQEQLSNAPYQQMSYYQDVLNKTPSGQTQTSTTSAPAASPISGILGLAATGIGAYNAFK